jgi:hypothetical protein
MVDKMKKEKKTPEQEAEQAWMYLREVLPPELLHAPLLNWDDVDTVFVLYLYRQVRGTPWFIPLAFALAIQRSYGRQHVNTIFRRLNSIHTRWRTIFQHYNLSCFEEWNPSEHLPRYLNDLELPDTLTMRQMFLSSYTAVTNYLAIYLRAVPETSRKIYQHWILPPLPAGLRRALSGWGVLIAEQHRRRKETTDALAPHFARIRGEAHLRWNQLKRLQDKYREAVARIQSGQEVLPFTFSYEEPRLKQRLTFRLWDRYSFATTYRDQYGRRVKRRSEHQVDSFSPENNHVFLEFVHAESLTESSCDPDSLLWFGDLLRFGVLGSNARLGATAEEGQCKQDYLRSWGYGREGQRRLSAPFSTHITGLLTTPHAQANYLCEAQKRSKGLLFFVEPLFAGATFGLAALDCFTTTGARVDEVLQVSLDPDCLYTLEIEGVQRFLIRAIPKGSDKPADYSVGSETIRNLEKVGAMLQEHYHLQPGECLPAVPFHARNYRAHLFKQPRPYLFQYAGRQLDDQSVAACMRFLCHGLVFQTAEGRNVTLTPHALRHVFATHIHQVEGVPLDVVAVMLHQKNVGVTAYYAAPPWQQVLATANSLLDRFAMHLGSVEETFVRAPAELQRQLEEAKQQVGTLTRVPGGECTCHALCPISFACTGCVFKVPVPEREEEIIEQEQWAFVRLEQVKRRRLGPEVVKMQALIGHCQTEREEMRLIRDYRRDEQYEPQLIIEPDATEEHAPSLVEDVS